MWAKPEIRAPASEDRRCKSALASYQPKHLAASPADLDAKTLAFPPMLKCQQWGLCPLAEIAVAFLLRCALPRCSAMPHL